MIIIKTEITLKSYLTKDEHNHFWNSFIIDAIEENNLQYGGLNSGIIEPSNPKKVLDLSDEKKVKCWLNNRTEVEYFNLELYEE